MRDKSHSDFSTSLGGQSGESSISGVLTRRIVCLHPSVDDDLLQFVGGNGMPSSFARPDNRGGCPTWVSIKCRAYSNLGQLLLQQLLVVQVAVVAVQGQELVMSAELDDTSAMQYGYALGVAHG